MMESSSSRSAALPLDDTKPLPRASGTKSLVRKCRESWNEFYLVPIAMVFFIVVVIVVFATHPSTGSAANSTANSTPQQTNAPVVQSAPVKHVKLIHTTDIHGWVMGHRHIAGLDADAADFLSMTTHMKTQAESSVGGQNPFDFLMFDSGDLIEGTGLSDATAMHGYYIYPIIAQLPYTALSPGNHDLGANAVIEYLYENFSHHWGDQYISTNVNYNNTGSPLGGSRAFMMKTPNGINILVFGIIFDFGQAGSLANVQRVENLVNTTFFSDNLKNLDEIDLVFAIGHYPPGGPEQYLIYGAVREYAPHIPLIMLAGHSHQLFFNQTDANSYIIQSDHYFLHIGHVEFGLDMSSKTIVNLTCEFVNTSSSELQRLSGVSGSEFLTAQAQQLRQTMTDEFDSLNLETVFGCSPQEFSVLSDWSLPSSLFYQVLNLGLPKVLYTNETEINHITIVSMGFLRTDMYPGHVIEDDVQVQELRQTMTDEFDSLNLETVFGCSPQEFSVLNDWSLPSSLFYQLLNLGLPKVLYTNETEINHIAIVNTGFLRTDMYPGSVIEDDILSIIPFVDFWTQHTNITGADFIEFLNALGNTSPDIALYIGKPSWANEYHHRRIHHLSHAGRLSILDTPVYHCQHGISED
eukprot:TRINITY_DN5302_c0_g1_i3.p1 TRINITY_DN5302_c0_g1~~TRINITY_DN5302_c0_g1_i3.p1  ORF type:complete len:636 (-),score=125.85 TRINITY_DN5302_c0_g1_i3:496-2403(-)